MEDALARIKAAGKARGILTTDPALIRRYADIGVEFLAIGWDVGALVAGLKAIRANIETPPPEAVGRLLAPAYSARHGKDTGFTTCATRSPTFPGPAHHGRRRDPASIHRVRAPVRLEGSKEIIEISNAADAVSGASVKVALRPERMKINGKGDGIPAKLRATVFRGSYYAYELEVEGADKPVYVYADVPIKVPEDGYVGLTFNTEYSILLKPEAV